MARDRVPVLKRCRSLNLDPIYLGIDKKSKRQNQRANKKMSEYGLQMREKHWKNSSEVTTHRLKRLPKKKASPAKTC